MISLHGRISASYSTLLFPFRDPSMLVQQVPPNVFIFAVGTPLHLSPVGAVFFCLAPFLLVHLLMSFALEVGSGFSRPPPPLNFVPLLPPLLSFLHLRNSPFAFFLWLRDTNPYADLLAPPFPPAALFPSKYPPHFSTFLLTIMTETAWLGVLLLPPPSISAPRASD